MSGHSSLSPRLCFALPAGVWRLGQLCVGLGQLCVGLAVCLACSLLSVQPCFWGAVPMRPQPRFALLSIEKVTHLLRHLHFSPPSPGLFSHPGQVRRGD